MSDQAEMQSSSVDAAAQKIEQSGVLDQFLEAEGQPKAEPAPEEVEEEQEEAEPETTDQVEEEEAEEEQAEPPEKEEQEDAESDEETQPLETLDELAEALDTPLEALKDTLKVTLTVDGEAQTVTLGEALAGYQKDADYRRKTSELAEHRRSLEAEYTELAQNIEYQHQVSAQMLQMAESQLRGELDNLNLSELRTQDPQAWAAHYAALTERNQQIQQAKQNAAQAYQAHTQQLHDQTTEKAKVKQAEERELLVQAIPDIEEIKPQLVSYLTDSMGFTPELIGTVMDHRLFVMARKAMLHDANQGKATVAKKKIKLAPKMQKAAKPQAQPVKRTEFEKAKARFKKSRDVKDAALAIEHLL